MRDRASKDEKKNIYLTPAIDIEGTRFEKAQVTKISGQTLFLTSAKLTFYRGGTHKIRKVSVVFASLEQNMFVQTTALSDLFFFF